MNFKKLSMVYAIIIGLSMIGMWLMFYLSNSIPELATEPIRIGMHISAEIITALLLIAGGIGFYTNKQWGKNLYLIALGMLLYTLIQSPGYFLEQGDYAMVLMFFVMFVLGLVIAVKLIKTHFE